MAVRQERENINTEWNGRSSVNTNWDTRVSINTNWDNRLDVETDWDGRNRPIAYAAELKDAYGIVHDEDNQIVYIYSSVGKAIPGTIWTVRPLISTNE